MDSTAQTALRDYDIMNETASTGDAWIQRPTQNPSDSYIINETAATGDAWIRQPKQPLGTQISSTKLLPRVTLGFDNPTSS
jgi:hypothetical protein